MTHIFMIYLTMFLFIPFVWAGKVGLDDFSSSKIGSFPKIWRTWPLERGEAASVYQVAEGNGTRFIKAYDDHDASKQIFLNFDWRIKDRSLLSWKWRATKLPEGAKESDDATNDSACAVYVVVGKYQGHAIKYVWSTTLPTNTIVTRRDGKLKIKVVDSGPKDVGKWIEHSVDVTKDYEELFGNKLEKQPSGIALLTDGNAVHKPAGCDYANFSIGN